MQKLRQIIHRDIVDLQLWPKELGRMPPQLNSFYYAQMSPIISDQLIDAITATPKINLNGLLAIY